MAPLLPTESLPRPELARLQAERLRATLARAARVPVYRARLAEAGVGPESVRGPEDVARLPFTTKADFRAAYPFGLLAVPQRPGPHPCLLRHHREAHGGGLHPARPGGLDRGDGPDAPGRGRDAGGRRPE